MMLLMLQYTSDAQNDPEGLYVPHRFVRRPRIKWDHYLKQFFQQHFLDRSNEHWSCVMKHVNCRELESAYINFSLHDNDSL